MRSGVINCHILSIYYGISGKLLASTHPNYPMVEFPNFRYSHRLSSRGCSGPGPKVPKG
jgi:hypothetical protein